MPIHNAPRETGELIVTFQVELLEELASEQRSELMAFFCIVVGPIAIVSWSHLVWCSRQCW
jgi:hypothetical protein